MIVQCPNGPVRSFRGPPSPPSFSTGPWSSCIVTGQTRCADDRREQQPLLRRLPRAGTVLVQCSAMEQWRSTKCFTFQVGLAPAAQVNRPGVHAFSFVLASSNAVHAVCRRMRSSNRERPILAVTTCLCPTLGTRRGPTKHLHLPHSWCAARSH